MSQISDWQKRAVENNRMLGWRDEPVTFERAIANLHGEVSEAWEAWREHGLKDMTVQPERCINPATGNQVLSKPEGVGSEFADVLIRLLDDCDLFGVDLAVEVERKLAYNATRAYRHGGKRA
jgi:NTP pyrophosphatase (non-canonical NTP hydrolase)